MKYLKSINPSTYEEIGRVQISTKKVIENAVALAHNAKENWRNIGLEKRIQLLRKVFEELAEKKDEMAVLISKEMGMPINESMENVDSAVDNANWYFENAKKYLSPETSFENDTEISQVFYEPMGVIVSILPWNFPINNVVWSCVQALIAGNVIVVKLSEECPLSGKFIEKIFNNHLPEGVFAEVYGLGKVGAELIEQDINMITFTGSTGTGKYIYEVAGKRFIKAVMELGGSAPGIIFGDADIELAVENACMQRLYNQGQCCDGLKRLIVHESVFKQVLEKIIKIFKNKKVGNSEDKSTEIGPLVSKRQLDLLISQCEEAKSRGAKIEVGGKSLEKELGGAFFEPTVITNIKKDMKVWTDEVFGPILPIIKFQTDKEAVELANDTKYGLGAYVYTKNMKRADIISQALESGMVNVNGVNYIRPSNPFGGYKNSGIGRQHGKYGFHEVTQIKVIARNK